MPMVRILEIEENASAHRTTPKAPRIAVGRPHIRGFSLPKLRVFPDCREHREPFQYHHPKITLSTVLPFPFPVHLSAGECSMQGSSSDPCPSTDGANQRKLRLAWCALLIAPLIFGFASLGRLLEWW
jgi:hypothetical protein